MNFEKILAQAPDEIPGFLVGRDERRDHEDTMPFQPACKVTDSTNMRIALRPGKAGLGKNLADRIPIQMLYPVATLL